MESMSAYFDKLEAFPDLEVGIIEKTKIHKALKAILRLDFIPKDDEHKFKQRSQRLLDQWLKILAGDGNPSGEAVNGANGSAAEPSRVLSGRGRGTRGGRS